MVIDKNLFLIVKTQKAENVTLIKMASNTFNIVENI